MSLNLARGVIVQLGDSVVEGGVQRQRMAQMKRASKHVHLVCGVLLTAAGGGGMAMIQRPTKAKGHYIHCYPAQSCPTGLMPLRLRALL